MRSKAVRRTGMLLCLVLHYLFIGLLGVLFVGIETRGRTIDEIDQQLARAQPALSAEKEPAH